MKSDIDEKKYIANYELNAYRYSNFWEGRQYEHEAEVFLLKRLFTKFLPDLSHRVIIDVGGAYGRLAEVYAPQALATVLADYSTKELTDGQARLANKAYYKKLLFVALNAYKLPFKPSSIDAALSVRVMHHLKTPDIFFHELSRVLSPGSVAIIEFAHKNHIVALLRELRRGNLRSYLASSIQKVSHKHDSQGMKTGQESIMFNFSESYIRKTALAAGFSVEGVYSCSFFRSPFLKKKLGVQTLVTLEKIAQSLFSWLHITPSLFIVLKKSGMFSPRLTWDGLAQLACPLCGETEVVTKEGLLCVNKHHFPVVSSNIIDLRDPRPEEVTF